MAIVLNGTSGAQIPLGTAAAPSATNTTAQATGLYFPSSTTLGLSTNGTAALTIDASQNVGIGTASPTYQTQIYGSGQQTAALTDAGNKGGSLLLNTPTVNAGDGGALLIGAGGSGAKPFAAIKGLLSNGSNNTIGSLAFATRNATTDTALTERMRIDSDGILLVGTTSATGGRIVSESVNFNTVGADNWKKGAFNGRGAFGGPLSFVNTSGSSDGFAFYLTNTPSQLNIQFGANGGALSAGVYMTSTATSWTAQSDERLKDITSLITDAVQSISELRPVRYTLKSDKLETKTQRVGLIAQDVQKVLPEVVDTDANGYLGVRYSEIVPLLVAAIQELKAELDALKGTK